MCEFELLSGTPTHRYCVLPRITCARALFLRCGVYCRQRVGPDGNTRQFAMPTHAETRRSIPLPQSRHQRPSCQARNRDVFQMHAVIESVKPDSNSELGHLKVNRVVTNWDHAMEVLADVGEFEVMRLRSARAPPSDPRSSLRLPLACSAGTSRGLRCSWASIWRAARCTLRDAVERSWAWRGWQRAVERSRGWIETEEG